MSRVPVNLMFDELQQAIDWCEQHIGPMSMYMDDDNNDSKLWYIGRDWTIGQNIYFWFKREEDTVFFTLKWT
jgi:hypothetical protein